MPKTSPIHSAILTELPLVARQTDRHRAIASTRVSIIARVKTANMELVVYYVYNKHYQLFHALKNVSSGSN